MARFLWIGVLVSLLAGCGDRDRPPPPPVRDAGPRMDAGPLPDTGPPPPRRDAGPPGPTLDGVLDDDEWDDARVVTQTLATDRPGSTLTRLLAYIDDDRLYIGVEASLADGDSLIAYVDAAVGQEGGIADLADLTDTDQPLDAALSRELDLPDRFAPELAFGTTSMDRTLMGIDANIGWRQLGDGSSFTWLNSAEAGFACSEDACEGSVPLDRLPADDPRTIGLFVRIAGEDGLSNQTLPSDAPGTPGVVRAWLEVNEGDGIMDAGVPLDAGVMDAGPPGIVIDGRMDDGEWDGAATTSNTTVAIGGFVGNALRQMWVQRDDVFVYLAVNGALTAGNAILVYVDHDYTGFDGLASPTPLDDTTGGLDRALAKSLFTPPEFRLDFAWGTLGFSRSGTLDANFGWRDVGTNPTTFRAVETPTACGADLCETRIRLDDLGLAPADDVALFARLGSANNLALSTLTLPPDDPGAAEFINVPLVVSPPAP
ncbi:MAG: hypothetical protein AB8I08_04385 [Sandaracinaceae bacterium]